MRKAKRNMMNKVMKYTINKMKEQNIPYRLFAINILVFIVLTSICFDCQQKKCNQRALPLPELVVEKFSNGQIKEKGAKVMNLKQGYWIEYRDNGQISIEAIYRNDTLNGTIIFYSNSGKIASEGQMKNGESIGRWKLYFPDGKLNATGDYKNNHPFGEWTIYNEDGSFKEKVVYK